MIAISERMTAEKTVEEVENKLSEFSFSLGMHIVGILQLLQMGRVLW